MAGAARSVLLGCGGRGAEKLLATAESDPLKAVRDCCGAVFEKTQTEYFDRFWGRAGVAQANIIRDAADSVGKLEKEMSRPGGSGRRDIGVKDATYYLETMARFCESVAGDRGLAGRIRATARGLRAGPGPAAREAPSVALPGPEGPGGRRRYWFESDPLRDAVSEEAESIGPRDVEAEIARRLRAEAALSSWGGRVLVAGAPEEVADADEMTLVIVPPDGEPSEERMGVRVHDMDRVAAITTTGAGGDRRFRNSLAFVVAEPRALALLERAVRDHLALSALRYGPEGRGPGGGLGDWADEADEDVRYLLRRAYSVLVVPAPRRGGGRPTYMTGPFASGNIADGAVSTMDREGLLLTDGKALPEGLRWSPSMLAEVLEELHRRGELEDGYLPVSELRDTMLKDCGLPRLVSDRALLGSVESAAAMGLIVYAYDAEAVRGPRGGLRVRLDWTTRTVRMEGAVLRMEDAVAFGWRPPERRRRLKGQGTPFERGEWAQGRRRPAAPRCPLNIPTFRYQPHGFPVLVEEEEQGRRRAARAREGGAARGNRGGKGEPGRGGPGRGAVPGDPEGVDGRPPLAPGARVLLDPGGRRGHPRGVPVEADQGEEVARRRRSAVGSRPAPGGPRARVPRGGPAEGHRGAHSLHREGRGGGLRQVPRARQRQAA